MCKVRHIIAWIILNTTVLFVVMKKYLDGAIPEQGYMDKVPTAATVVL